VDLQPTELQELLRSNAEDFLSREVPSSRVREMQEAGEPDSELWEQIVELGWAGLPITEEYGGQGGSLLDTAVVINQLCRFAVLSPFVSTVLASLILQRYGDEGTKEAFLPRIPGDGATVSIALAENRGESEEGVATTFDGNKVSGEKRFVEYARSTDYHLVAARNGDELGLALVPREDSSVRIVQDLASIGMTPQAIVSYEDAPAEAWIAGEEAVTGLRQLGSAMASLESYSHAQRALDMTVDYVRTRVQFGRPIGTFQAVQMRLADLATRVQASHFLTHELLWNFEHATEEPSQIGVVKAITADTVTRVTQDCHLLHGGIGFITEYDLYFHTIRGKEAALRYGSVREALGVIADKLLN
jgi:alkylation response protein AidB-like acyl-CoA dehydrogenase